MGELSDRRALAAQKLEILQVQLADAERLVRRKACVYVTGSFGRCEASGYSDLDLFILGQGRGRSRPLEWCRSGG